MSADDKKVPPSFRDYVGAVRPLRQRSGRVPPVKIAPPVGQVRRAPASPRPGDVVFERRDDGLTMEGARAGAEQRLRDLKKAKFRVIESLDLHGMTSTEAQHALRGFLDRLRGPRERAVLVVHGRGTHSPGGRGILRDEIASWLVSSPLAAHVLCFATARPADGGAGAVYVLLAPRR
jgi:DNA-nicking Smr family endonuclease